MNEQNEQRIREIIREVICTEADKLGKSPIIKEVHLHIHGNKLDSVRFLKELENIQSAILQVRIMEAIKDKLS